MDGQSLAPLLGPGGATQNWRTDFLVELYRHLPPVQNGDVIKALRTEHEVYVEYQSGPRELYDLVSDPYQLQNIYATADPAHIADLSARLAELAASQGNPPTLPGDFNGDATVDGADLDNWKSGFGTAAGATTLHGDADGDGDVDGGDFLAWQRQLGASNVQASMSPAPEPVSGAFAESVVLTRGPQFTSLDGQTTARDQAFSALARSRGFGPERRSRSAPFELAPSVQLKRLNDRDPLSPDQGRSRRICDLRRGWRPPTMPAGDGTDRDTLERSVDEAFGTAGSGSSIFDPSRVTAPVVNIIEVVAARG